MNFFHEKFCSASAHFRDSDFACFETNGLNSIGNACLIFRWLIFLAGNFFQTDGWSELVKKHPELVTEVVAAISSNESRSANNSPGSYIEQLCNIIREHISNHDT